MKALRPIVAALALLACDTSPTPCSDTMSTEFTNRRSSEHRGNDDLLTGGLGGDGLRSVTAPAFVDATQPTAADLRRRAIWSNWRGIADLGPFGGYGALYGTFAPVPGREFHALVTVPGAKHPHRVMLQLPDDFDRARPCLVVSAASGSRGVYGAIAVASAWGLPKGCAVVHTDKGAGTDWFDLDTGSGTRADGTPAPRAEAVAFAPNGMGSGVAFKHAHSLDNPEADWGAHVRQATEFGLQVLGEAFSGAGPFTLSNTRLMAVAISNGGGAVLRAIEGDSGVPFDAVVVAAAQICVAGATPLYDYATQAALLMPCALSTFEDLPQPPMSAQVQPLWAARCASLRAAGLVEGEDIASQSASALSQLRAVGWSDGALRSGAVSTGFDLWRAIASTCASAYGRYGAGEHPCGYSFAAQGADFLPTPATAEQRAAWWSDASGIPPGAGVALFDSRMAGADPTLPGLQCLRSLWTGEGRDSERVRAGVAATRAGVPDAAVPTLLIHGLDDGLVPAAFTSAPYVELARASGRTNVAFWQVQNAQHFDAFLAFPDHGTRYVPLLPYVYAGLDQAWAHLESGSPLPRDAVISARPMNPAGPLTAVSLAIPR